MSAQSQNILSIVGNSNSVVINENFLPSGILFKNRSILKNIKVWHKFIISNTDGLSRNEILKAVLEKVHPLDLIPVFFAKDPDNSNSIFLARNCEAAIEKLCKDNLVIDHPYNKDSASRQFSPFKLEIILNFANTTDVKIDVQKNVQMVLNKRFDPNSKTLNLDCFHEDPDLTEYCPLFQPKIMYFVLHIANNYGPEEIILSNNNIKLLNPLDVLIGLKLRHIDLGNNELASLDDLGSLKHFNIKELVLTGNNLCNCEEADYIHRIRLLCPTVEILDGVPLSVDKLPVTKKYSFCDYDNIDLVNQFLEYFFTVYDSAERKGLAGLYHTNAMFSLTCVYLVGQISSGTAVLKVYSNIARNLKKFADLSKTAEFLFRGREAIINVFSNKLPQTVHDPYSFTVDLIYKTDKLAVIVITGVFREKAVSLLDKERLVGFTRSFVLTAIDAKYVITNDQLHLYNALSSQEKNSFITAEKPKMLIKSELLPRPQGKSDYSDLISTMCHITNLSEDWSRKCLEECSYDLKTSLELFVELYKADKIPRNAYIELGTSEPQTPIPENPNPNPKQDANIRSETNSTIVTSPIKKGPNVFKKYGTTNIPISFDGERIPPQNFVPEFILLHNESQGLEVYEKTQYEPNSYSKKQIHRKKYIRSNNRRLI